MAVIQYPAGPPGSNASSLLAICQRHSWTTDSSSTNLWELAVDVQEDLAGPCLFPSCISFLGALVSGRFCQI